MADKTNPIYTTKNRASGTTIELHDWQIEPVLNGVPNLLPGEPRWHVRCAEHDQVTGFKKQAEAYKAMTNPDWCTGCVELMTSKGHRREAAVEGFEAFAKEVTKDLLERDRTEEVEEVPLPPPAWQPPAKPPEGDLSNHQKVMQNICPLCDGVLKAPDGHWHETGRPPVECCCACKGHVVARIDEN